MTGFVPWSVPAGLGVALGAAAAAAGLPAALSWCAWALAPLLVRGRFRVWLALPLLLPIGHLRHDQREARPDALTPLTGRAVELAGWSDARSLRLEGTSVVVALRPVGDVPRGRVRVRGRLEAATGARNPGGFDQRAWLRRRGGAHLVRVDAVTSAQPEGGLRARMRAGVTAGLAPEPALLMRALVLGEREDASELRDTFARAGLAHLLALSGLHLGVLAAFVGTLLAPLGPARWSLVAAAAAAFTVWIGPTPSLIRAAVMTAAGGLSVASGAGRPDPPATLGLAATATLLARPDWLFDLAFQLSYLSLIGIVALGAPVARRLGRGRPARDPRVWLPASLAISTAATVAGLPLVVDAFGRAAPFGPAVNLIAVPLATVLLPLGLVAGVAGAFMPALGEATGWITEPLAEALLATAEIGARLPGIAWGGVAPLGVALWTIGLAPWAWTARGWLRPWRAAAVTSCAVAASLITAFPAPTPELVVLDVGQGDAVLLRLPRRTEVLIDGGGTPFSDYDVAAAQVLPALRALDVDELELVVSTHADMDHAEGLQTVLRSLPVAALAYGHPAPERPAWERLVAIAHAERVPLVPLRRGQVLRFGEAELHVLHPGERPSGEPNEDSVALRIDWRGRPWALLAGDVSTRVERSLAVPQLDVVLAPHHGSSHSTGAALLRAARPRYVAVSVGTNRYGHPSAAVLRRVRESGAEVLRTDELGAIRLAPSW
ncbi:MAG: ComEC/Rec2 family competence protein [Trueperaceae bacterium]|nr:ComEC/Rec2 family competence protein [Trueperaceae bacterium]